MDNAEDSIVVDTELQPRPKRRCRRSSVTSHAATPASVPASSTLDLSALPYEAHPPYDAAESLETALARFKAWMRAGAFHDERCYACHKAGGVNCATCRRSYHNHCDPNGTYKASDTSAWFCHVCIGRGWLASPPALTPPASPVQTPADISTAQNRKALPSSRKRSSPAASRQRKGRSKSPGERPGPSTTASGVSHEPERPARARKSRYTTLPKDVDGALRILYTELEVAGESRQQVARLTDDVTRLKQELELAQKQLDLERQVSQSARALRQEVTRLTSEAAQQQANAEEVATLKREKQEMESELLATKAELTKMKQTLLDLKRSLSSLGEIS